MILFVDKICYLMWGLVSHRSLLRPDDLDVVSVGPLLNDFDSGPVVLLLDDFES